MLFSDTLSEINEARKSARILLVGPTGSSQSQTSCQLLMFHVITAHFPDPFITSSRTFNFNFFFKFQTNTDSSVHKFVLQFWKRWLLLCSYVGKMAAIMFFTRCRIHKQKQNFAICFCLWTKLFPDKATWIDNVFHFFCDFN